MPDVFGVQVGAEVAAAAGALVVGLASGWLSVLWFVSWRAAREAAPAPVGVTFREAVDAAAAAKASRQPGADPAFADGVDAVVAHLVSRDAHDETADLQYAYRKLAYGGEAARADEAERAERPEQPERADKADQADHPDQADEGPIDAEDAPFLQTPATDRAPEADAGGEDGP